MNHDDLLKELLVDEFNLMSSTTSNATSSPNYDYSPKSNNSSNESDSSTTVVLKTGKNKSNNEIILNINDIGMERLKNQMKSNSRNESCIELEEYESDEDVVTLNFLILSCILTKIIYKKGNR
jgi:hypothetical protein